LCDSEQADEAIAPWSPEFSSEHAELGALDHMAWGQDFEGCCLGISPGEQQIPSHVMTEKVHQSELEGA